MRLTFNDIRSQFLRNIGKSGLSTTSPEGTVILADFTSNLRMRYQQIYSHLQNYTTQVGKTASTVASQQYYHYPVGISKIDDVVITIGSVQYPLKVINSQHSWDVKNAITIQPSAIPEYIFPRRDDFGIWPIPQAAYTITFYSYIRDRSLSVEDYSTGSVSLTNGSTTVTGSGTTFTAGMVGRWFEVTDTNSADYGYWYRIAGYTNATTITLENSWQGTTASGLTYRIGQTPEIPEEGHILLPDGVTADYYAGIRVDMEKSTAWENKFWTGQMNNSQRKIGDDNIKAGLIGLVNKYSDRDESALVLRQPPVFPPNYKVFAQTIS